MAVLRAIHLRIINTPAVCLCLIFPCKTALKMSFCDNDWSPGDLDRPIIQSARRPIEPPTICRSCELWDLNLGGPTHVSSWPVFDQQLCPAMTKDNTFQFFVLEKIVFFRQTLRDWTLVCVCHLWSGQLPQSLNGYTLSLGDLGLVFYFSWFVKNVGYILNDKNLVKFYFYSTLREIGFYFY